jgi:hypothetical protein
MARLGSGLWMRVLVAGAVSMLAEASARGSGGAEPRAPMPEPLVFETATDIDGLEAGELEVDALGSMLRDRDLGSAWNGVLSGELKATSRLGIEAELGGGGPISAAGSAGWTGRLTVSFAVVHDLARDLHVQLEAGGSRAGFERIAEPGDPALPYFVGARWGVRQSWLTMRGGLDGELGGHAAHAPVLVDVELLGQWARPDAPSYAGVELAADLGRRAPFSVVPEISFGLRPQPFGARVGFAIPLTSSASGALVTVGGLIRLVFEVGS